jgi:hypothetical protein
VNQFADEYLDERDRIEHVWHDIAVEHGRTRAPALLNDLQSPPASMGMTTASNGQVLVGAV